MVTGVMITLVYRGRIYRSCQKRYTVTRQVLSKHFFRIKADQGLFFAQKGKCRKGNVWVKER